MTLEKKISALDSTPLIGYYDLEKIILEIREDRVLYAKVKPHCQVQLSDIKIVEKIMETDFPNQTFLNLFDFDEFSDLDEDVRTWASNPDGNTRTIADAAVIRSLSQRMIANFYIKFNKPPKPTKFFTDSTQALLWLKKHLD